MSNQLLVQTNMIQYDLAQTKLAQLLSTLPQALQNKIFYFTMHPVAELFRKEFDYFQDLLENNIMEQKHYTTCASYYYHETFNYTKRTWKNEDHRFFITAHSLIKLKHYNLIDSYFNLYHKSRICSNCDEKPIFNKVDIYCTYCIKRIRNLNSQIYSNNDLYNLLRH
jgi:hypothetical protein